jgi:hypothetical protein
MTESKIMKTISEMNQEEKTVLLKTIEESRINKIKTLKDTLEYLTNKPKEFEDEECLKYEMKVSKHNSEFCVCGIKFKKGMGKYKFKCGKSHCELYKYRKNSL